MKTFPLKDNLTIEELRTILEVVLKGSVAQFVYIKEAGENRLAIGTLRTDILPDFNAGKSTPIKSQDQTAYFNYWDLGAKNWRKFDLNKIDQTSLRILSDSEEFVQKALKLKKG